MRKFVYYSIPIITLVIFTFVMLSGTYFKNSRIIKGDFPEYLETVKSDISSEQWDNAASDVDKLDNSWKRVVRRVQFSAERNEINDININLSRLRGAIGAKDKSIALVELSEARMHWDNLGK